MRGVAWWLGGLPSWISLGMIAYGYRAHGNSMRDWEQAAAETRGDLAETRGDLKAVLQKGERSRQASNPGQPFER